MLEVNIYVGISRGCVRPHKLVELPYPVWVAQVALVNLKRLHLDDFPMFASGAKGLPHDYWAMVYRVVEGQVNIMIDVAGGDIFEVYRVASKHNQCGAR